MAGDRGASYADRIIARARELHARDAFEPARHEEGHVAIAAAKSEAAADFMRGRRLVVLYAVLAAAITAFSLLLPFYGFDTMGVGGTVLAPGDVLDCYGLWFQLNVAPLFDSSLYNRSDIILSSFQEAHGSVGLYPLVINRAAATLIVVVCGVMLALSGLLFQTSFRNPLAAPTALGVSDGVTLGCIIFAMQGYGSIMEAPALYLQLVYGLGVLAVVVVLLLSRGISGGRRYNVLDMLLLGTVICQLLAGVNRFVENFVMSYDTWAMFYDVQQAADALRDPLVRHVVLAVFILTFVPALVLRFKLNLVAFSDDDGKMMGVRAGLLRGAALVLGSAMQLAAIASMGPVAMLSLAVPFVVRYMLPADFGSQFLGNCLVGVTVLLACVCIQHFAVIGFMTVPVGTIVSVFIIPFFIWMVTFGKGRW